MLAMLTGMFACGLIGFYIGRNTGFTDVQISDYVEPTSPTNSSSPHATDPTKPQRININTASALELEQLPGIGPVIAQRIVDYRNANGPFKTVSELTLVEDIGITILEKIMDLVTVGG